MSFTDFGTSDNNRGGSSNEFRMPQRASVNSAGSNLDGAVGEIGDLLTKFQATCNTVKSKVDAAGKSPVSPATKAELDSHVKVLKGIAAQLKDKLDAHIKEVNTLPRDQAVGRRVSVVKLQKDHERVKVLYQNILKNYSVIRVDRNSSPAPGSRDGKSSETFSAAYDNSDSASPSSQRKQQQQQQLMLQGEDVDMAIIEERERDIKKINHDLVMVNEMFRDMAHIVESQGGTIDKIAQDTEVSRERAEQGLAEVKQAAAYQPGCILC